MSEEEVSEVGVSVGFVAVEFGGTNCSSELVSCPLLDGKVEKLLN